jgi:hypothetical protein
MAIPGSFYWELLALTLSPLLTTLSIRFFSGARKKVEQPKRDKENLESFQSEVRIGLSDVNDKIDKLAESYQKGADRNKKSQQTMFRVQDLQFSAMSSLSGGVRELAHSICNGNKDRAMSFCDEVDSTVAEGHKMQNEYLIDK